MVRVREGNRSTLHTKIMKPEYAARPGIVSEPVRETQFKSQLLSANCTAEGLLKIVHELEKHLSNVLRTEPANEKEPSSPVAVLVPAAEEIRGLEYKMSVASKRLVSIIDRLEC